MTERPLFAGLSITLKSSGKTRPKFSPLPDSPSVDTIPSASHDQIASLERVCYSKMNDSASKEAAMAQHAGNSLSDPGPSHNNGLGVPQQPRQESQYCWLNHTKLQHGTFNPDLQQSIQQELMLVPHPSAPVIPACASTINQRNSASLPQNNGLEGLSAQPAVSVNQKGSASIVNQRSCYPLLPPQSQNDLFQKLTPPVKGPAATLHLIEVATPNLVVSSIALQLNTPLPSPSDAVHTITPLSTSPDAVQTSRKHHRYTEEERQVFAVLEYGTEMKPLGKAEVFSEFFGKHPFETNLPKLSHNLQSQKRYLKNSPFVQAFGDRKIFSSVEMQLIMKVTNFVPQEKLNEAGLFYKRQNIPSASSNTTKYPSEATTAVFPPGPKLFLNAGEMRANMILHLVAPTDKPWQREKLGSGFRCMFPNHHNPGPLSFADSLKSKFNQQKQTSTIASEIESMRQAKPVKDLDDMELVERGKLLMEITGVLCGANLRMDRKKWDKLQGFVGIEERLLAVRERVDLQALWTVIKTTYPGAHNLPDNA